MSQISIITNDEIIEITQLVFDRYYTELKRQLRRSELSAEEVEQQCTAILSKVYQAVQEQGFSSDSHRMDACAIPIINEEIRKILVPLHLNEYRNRRENPLPKVAAEQVKEFPYEAKDKQENPMHEMTEIPVPPVQVIGGRDVSVYTDRAEDAVNAELRTQIRHILQQEYHLEAAQVKPIVVVVNVTAPASVQPVQQPERPVEQKTVQSVEPTVKTDVQAEGERPVEQKTMQSVEPTVKTDVQAEAEAHKKNAVAESESCKQVSVMQSEAFEQVSVTLSESESQIPDSHRQAESSERFTVTERQTELEEETLPVLFLPEIREELAEKTSEGNPKKKRRNKRLFVVILLVILILAIAWIIFGQLMSFDVIPDYDLGYEWFDKYIVDLFRIYGT